MYDFNSFYRFCLLSCSLNHCDFRIFILVIAAVHESCIQEMDTSISNGAITSFCGKTCREVAKIFYFFHLSCLLFYYDLKIFVRYLLLWMIKFVEKFW